MISIKTEIFPRGKGDDPSKLVPLDTVSRWPYNYGLGAVTWCVGRVDLLDRSMIGDIYDLWSMLVDVAQDVVSNGRAVHELPDLIEVDVVMTRAGRRMRIEVDPNELVLDAGRSAECDFEECIRAIATSAMEFHKWAAAARHPMLLRDGTASLDCVPGELLATLDS